MKPCSNRRKPIALLVLEELDNQEAYELRSHLQSCEGCRHYFAEISAVTEKLAVAANAPEIEGSDAFHRGVVARLRAQKSAQRKIAGLLEGLLNWRIALPATAVCVALIIGLRGPRQASDVQRQPLTPKPDQIASAREANADIPPTIGNYQMAAEESLQKFDELLNREAKLPPPDAPSYSASTLTLAGVGQ